MTHPLPTLIVPPPSRSRRVNQRRKRTFSCVGHSNKVINSLNHLSHSFISPSNIAQHHHQNKAYSHRLSLTVHQSVTAYRRSCSGVAPVDAQLIDDNELFFDLDKLLPSIHYKTPLSVQRLRSEAVSLPAVAGTADLLGILPDKLAKLYFDPNNLLRPKEEVQPASHVVMVENGEYEKVIQRMHKVGMVSFTREPKVVNGIFGVVKDVDKQRLIIDARPSNAIFQPPPHTELPSPDLLAHFTLSDDQKLYFAKADLDNFYHRIRLPPSWHQYFALPAVRAGDVGAIGYDANDMVYPCCSTLPMGFAHSVYLAQMAHEHIINSRTSLRAADRLCRDGDFNLDRPRHFVYIDDSAIWATDPQLVHRLQDEYIAAMESVGLPAKPSKVVRATENDIELLGMVFNGTSGNIGVSVAKRQRLAAITNEVLRIGYCSGDDLSKLVGRFTWTMLIRRPSLSIFSAVYRFMAVAKKKRYALWPSVRRELTAAMNVIPLLSSSMRASWRQRLTCVDASSKGMGVVYNDDGVNGLIHQPASRVPIGGNVNAIVGTAV